MNNPAGIHKHSAPQRQCERRSHIAWAAALIAGTLAATASYAAPRSDGLWSVVIVTKKGDCIASYRYPMQIVNGVLGNGGALAIEVKGSVSASGAVRVTVSSGDKRATGLGRLVGNNGSGSWNGAGCSGSWTAERRSS